MVSVVDKKQILRELKAYKKFPSDAAFARFLGITPQGLATWQARNTFDINKIVDKFPEVDEVWLLTGKGEMLKAASKPVVMPAGIPFYDIDVTGGITESFSDFPEMAQYRINYPPLNDCTAAFPVYGESMEPDFYSGEVVLVKEITKINSMLWGEPYLVITNANCDNLRTIKNVYISDDRKNFILRASNPRFAGDTIVPCADVLKIFIVKGKVSRRQL